ncbi:MULTISPECIES: bifunctional GNAT family N-acetyltransferase/acetate--CoA ligase family protein [unclassified Brevibacterium]|uniref:bifunctional acetate--CoA ligase family protein/GNAT family N-acetyltransferase n=1 Tax=unclassified Brevibacterium TaxID=2614124 RepID=UPI001E6328F9|nr:MULTISPECIES: bifunctional GNAT family N-acetyltransferase/acetate--CoA ligase family protein [unclassified Brevibacterium]MCD1284418.1 GNAT family N-acetyltransferase [Brevibacterium sp. CCUG 69071]MDK8435968.1 GNAT family N-acetyltransferase [Brevibacterium sp. H-BE7]
MEDYPAEWEADVVLRDGGTAHLRPIVPADAEALARMHEAQSPESVYLRFFAPLPRLPKRDLDRFVNVDHHDRVALIMLIGDDIIGVGRFDKISATSAEVAFNIADAHQGRGIGSILLEHLAAAAREAGIRRFTAEVLPQNRSMLQVFQAAGYEVDRGFDDGVVAVNFDIDPTARSIAVQASREHRAEALSVRTVLHPTSVVVIGASRKRNSTGNLLIRNITGAKFTGDLWVVHPEADQIAGVRAYRTLGDLPGKADLAVIAVPAESATEVVQECAAHGVKAVLVISSGFAETGAEGAELQRQMVSTARAYGMRVVGPNSFGLVNDSADVSLNASLAPFLPASGTLGLFSQSGALGTALLAAAKSRGLGISTFVSAGNRADLSGNDVLQYWEEDPDTETIGLYLESIGNPRKFSRIARRVSRVKPVIVIKSDLTGRELPPGHIVRTSSLAPNTLDQVLEQAGVIRADTIHQLFDLAQVFSTQPLPAGRRVGVIGNSAALATLVIQRSRSEGLHVESEPVSLHPEVDAETFRTELTAMYARYDIDSVVVTFTPSAGAEESEIAAHLAETAAQSKKTTVACFLGIQGVKDELTTHLTDDGGSRVSHTVPSYVGPEDAVWALARTTDYARWRAADHGNYLELDDLDDKGVRAIIDSALAEARPGVPLRLDRSDTRALLSCYGIEVLPYITASTVDEGLDAAEEIGYPVALKAVTNVLRHRMELGGVRLNIDTPEELIEDFTAVQRIITQVIGESEALVDVQAMAPHGVPCVIRAGEDTLLGPLLSFSLAGDTTELLGDVAHRVAPLTDRDAGEMIRSIKASPRLFGYRGLPQMNIAPLARVLERLSILVERHPQILELVIHPMVATEDEGHVLSARIDLLAHTTRIDSTRRLLS